MTTFENIDLKPFSSLSIEEIADKYPLLGEGQARSVFDLGNGLVLKVADSGMEMDNEKEYEVWQKANDNLKKYLTPCFLDPEDSHKLYMLKTETLQIKKPQFESYLIDALNISAYTQLLNAMWELADTFLLMYHDLLLPQNWGIVNGEYKLIDYGMSMDTDMEDDED